MFIDRTRTSHFMLDTRDIPRKKIFMITEKNVKEISDAILENFANFFSFNLLLPQYHQVS